MPVTPYTEYCDHMFQLVQRLLNFIRDDVLPIIDSQASNHQPEMRRRDNVIQMTFVRIYWWLNSFDKLNCSIDVQAVSVGARSVFELYLDLKWFQKYNDPQDLERFIAFPELNRYRIAKKAIDHKHNPKSQINTGPMADFVQRMDSRKSISIQSQTQKLWGQTNIPLHWTGIDQIDKRALKLDDDLYDDYLRWYSILCEFTHAGPLSIIGETIFDHSLIERHNGLAMDVFFQYGLNSTQLICELFNARELITSYDDAIIQFGLKLIEINNYFPQTEA